MHNKQNLVIVKGDSFKTAEFQIVMQKFNLCGKFAMKLI